MKSHYSYFKDKKVKALIISLPIFTLPVTTEVGNLTPVSLLLNNIR
jgi:hypothetical protein